MLNIENSSSNNSNNNIIKKCPYCETTYSSINLIDQQTNLNRCDHLLFNYFSITHLNSTYKAVSNLTANVGGKSIPLVIAKRFIRYIRDRNGNTPTTGFYTIHQSKSRISNSFHGITSFSLIYHPEINSSNNTIKSIEYNYFLTPNPTQDLHLFESFVLANYYNPHLPISTMMIDSIRTHNNMNGNGNSYTIDSNYITIPISKNLLNTYMQRNEDEIESHLSQSVSTNDGADDNHDLHRWIMVLGLPELPHFILLSKELLEIYNDSINNTSENYLFNIPIKNHNLSNSNNNLNPDSSHIQIKIVPLIELPPVATFN
ncbi:hypothetical protein DLAC_08653 [Tieghemostelium lacteum]|uniref:Uncharacterized protein n=1 Tax=Tieghemostelium lacteum TaxID=361077 RepID=A0A151Z7X5_TIELA|nr:hypothetical protein DLAC_08653 [Tieghemostelium lacteum]|eukprot:KYQ90069.1 hypothetical protein DLAC_08653 [Tieghemostelium lacteum]